MLAAGRFCSLAIGWGKQYSPFGMGITGLSAFVAGMEQLGTMRLFDREHISQKV